VKFCSHIGQKNGNRIRNDVGRRGLSRLRKNEGSTGGVTGCCFAQYMEKKRRMPNKNGEVTATQTHVFTNQLPTCFGPDRPSSGDCQGMHNWQWITYKLHGSIKFMCKM
jgi:hypothetical protein